jgi:hypothetical protein
VKFDIENCLKKALGEPWGDIGWNSAIQRAQTRHVTCGPSINAIPRKFLLDTLRIRNVVAADSRTALDGPMTPNAIRQTFSPLRANLSILEPV